MVSKGDKVIILPVGSRIGGATYYLIQPGKVTKMDSSILVPLGNSLKSATYAAIPPTSIMKGEKVIVMPMGNSLSGATWYAIRPSAITCGGCINKDPAGKYALYGSTNTYWRFVLAPTETLAYPGTISTVKMHDPTVSSTLFKCSSSVYIYAATARKYGSGARSSREMDNQIQAGSVYGTSSLPFFKGGKAHFAYRYKGWLYTSSCQFVSHVHYSYKYRSALIGGKEYWFTRSNLEENIHTGATFPGSYPKYIDTGWQVLSTPTWYGKYLSTMNYYPYGQLIFETYVYNYANGSGTIWAGTCYMWQTYMCHEQP